jgi:hypothetical protein
MPFLHAFFCGIQDSNDKLYLEIILFEKILFRLIAFFYPLMSFWLFLHTKYFTCLFSGRSSPQLQLRANISIVGYYIAIV